MQVSEESSDDPLAGVLAGHIRSVEYSGGQVLVDAPRRGRIYLPGSFNPLHDGHRCAACSLRRVALPPLSIKRDDFREHLNAQLVANGLPGILVFMGPTPIQIGKADASLAA